MFDSEYKKLGNMTGTVHKQSPDLEALQALYERMEYEYEFYNFIKAQFHLTKRKIGLRSRRYSSVLQRKDLEERKPKTPERCPETRTDTDTGV